MPAPPIADIMDPLALFTHGEFTCYDNDDPELLLFTHGEFPRAASVAVVISKGPADAGQGSGGKRRRKIFDPQLASINNEIEIATTLLMADSEDDWDEWF